MLQNWLRKLEILKKKTFNPVFNEAALAYFHKLPDNIEVRWEKEGRFIVGWIKIEGEDVFMTQAKSAKEFVEMVNDAIYSVYKIPVQYFKLLEKKKFKPNPQQFELLNNATIKKFPWLRTQKLIKGQEATRGVLDLKKQLVTA